jgi:WD40 repeat protein
MDERDAIDLRLLVEQALACLSRETRLTVTLYYQREMSLQEIAAFQEVPMTTIKSRLRNARARLRKELVTILTESMDREAEDLTPFVLRRIGAAGEIGSVAISPGGMTLVTGVALEVNATRFDARLTAWEVASGNPLWATDLTSWFRDVQFTPDGTHVVVSTGLPGHRDGLAGRLLFLDAARGATVREIRTPRGAHCLALSVDGRFAAAGFSEAYEDYRSHGDKGVVRIYDLVTGEVVQLFEPHLNQVFAVAFSPDGKTLASSGLLREADPEAEEIWLGGDIRLWDLTTGAKLHQLRRPNARGARHNIVFSPDGELLAAPNGAEGEALLWDPRSGELARTLPGFKSDVFALAFSPTGRLLATGSKDAKVRLFEATNGQLHQTLESDHSGLAALIFTPDGSTLVSAHRDGTVQFWRLQPRV